MCERKLTSFSNKRSATLRNACPLRCVNSAGRTNISTKTATNSHHKRYFKSTERETDTQKSTQQRPHTTTNLSHLRSPHRPAWPSARLWQTGNSSPETHTMFLEAVTRPNTSAHTPTNTYTHTRACVRTATDEGVLSTTHASAAVRIECNRLTGVRLNRCADAGEL